MMTRILENQIYEFYDDYSNGRVFANAQFVNCIFVSCGFALIDIINLDNVDFIASRSLARDLKFVNCEVRNCQIGPGIVEDVTIDGLRLKGHLQTDGTVFKHVTVKGVVDKFMLTPYVDFFGHFPDVQRLFNEANREYYKNIDWALDISEAEFKDCDIRGIPSRLIRRDSKTQAILSREKAQEGKWKNIDLSETHWEVSIESLLEEGYQDEILVAPKKSRNYKKLLEGLYRLRDAGIVELD